MKPRVIAGQPSWGFRSDVVEAWLTCRGGHLAPVRFRLGRKNVQPFAIARWAKTRLPPGNSAAMQVLRGDLFCLPFGAESGKPWRGETYPQHGETANNRWRNPQLIRSADRVTLSVEQTTTFRPGQVRKELTLLRGHTAIYCRHVISGMSGPVTIAHHPTLQFPDRPGAGQISTSAFRFGQVFPHRTGDPELDGYCALEAGAVFRSLDRVPADTGGTADLSTYPARRGYDDIVLLATKPAAPFAWSAVSFPGEGYAWFSLKDPRVLASTQLWLANGGRHASPWHGRVRGVLGVEECTSYFTDGVAASVRANSLSKRGHPTFVRVSPAKPLVVNFIMGVVAIPRDFGRVAAIEPERGRVVLISTKSQRVACAVDHAFLSARSVAHR